MSPLGLFLPMYNYIFRVGYVKKKKKKTKLNSPGDLQRAGGSHDALNIGNL